MEITVMGYALLPLGVLLLFRKKELLLYCTVFFSGFTGSSVLQVEPLTFSLQPAYYFAGLFAAKAAFEWIRGDRPAIRPGRWMLVFIAICMLSLMMPVLLQHREVIVLTPEEAYVPVRFHWQNVTQFMYLLAGVVLYWLIRNWIQRDADKLRTIVRVLTFSAGIIVLLGFYQEIAFLQGWPYDEIFRSGVHGYVHIFGDFVRIYAVADEPSMYALFLAPMVALTLYADKDAFIPPIARYRSDGRHVYKWGLLTLMLGSGVLSTSTSFLLGMAVLAVFVLADMLFGNHASEQERIRIRRAAAVSAAAVAVFAAAAFLWMPEAKRLLTTDVLQKLNGTNTSGSLRMEAMLHHFHVSLDYPLLGVGFGASRSLDLLTTLLANIGYAGTAALIVYVTLLCIRLLRVRGAEWRALSKGMASFLIVMFSIQLVSVPELYYLYIWIAFAVGEALIALNAAQGRQDGRSGQGGAP